MYIDRSGQLKWLTEELNGQVKFPIELLHKRYVLHMLFARWCGFLKEKIDDLVNTKWALTPFYVAMVNKLRQ